MAAIRAAFDCSRDNRRGTTVVAGHVATTDTWAAIEDVWNLRLGLAGLPRFRLSDIRAEKELRDWLPVVSPFVDVIGDSHLQSVWAVLRDRDWSALDYNSEYMRTYPQREHACLDMALDALAHAREYTFEGQQIAVVFDRDWGNSGFDRVYNAWLERTGEPRFTLGDKDEPWCCVPLQAADLLAGLTRISPFEASMLLGRVREYRGSDEITDLALRASGDGGIGRAWSLALVEQVEATLTRLKLSKPSRDDLPE